MNAPSGGPVVAGASRPAASGSFEIHERSGGRLEVGGALTFATARKARQEGLRLFAASGVRDMEIDCSGISASDSAGLTVLLDWLSFARQEGRSLQLKNLPEPILAVARISDVTTLLENGVPADQGAPVPPAGSKLR